MRSLHALNTVFLFGVVALQRQCGLADRAGDREAGELGSIPRPATDLFYDFGQGTSLLSVCLPTLCLFRLYALGVSTVSYHVPHRARQGPNQEWGP